MSHDYVCPECGFKSMDWPTKKAAETRGKEHQKEHDTMEAMPELIDSEAKA